MVVFAINCNLQGATGSPQCHLTPNLFGARLEARLESAGALERRDE